MYFISVRILGNFSSGVDVVKPAYMFIQFQFRWHTGNNVTAVDKPLYIHTIK